jgi:uncharacterized membrane protein
VSLGIIHLIMSVCISHRVSMYHPSYRYVSGLYYGITIAIVSFATAMTVMTLNIHHKGTRGYEIPVIIKKLFFQVIAKLLFMKIDLPDMPPEPGLVSW